MTRKSTSHSQAKGRRHEEFPKSTCLPDRSWGKEGPTIFGLSSSKSKYVDFAVLYAKNKSRKSCWPSWIMMWLQKLFGTLNFSNKVNRCLARYSPRATTTNRPTNRALNKPARPGPNWPKMPVLGQIWSFLGKNFGRNQKFCYPHNGKPT